MVDLQDFLDAVDEIRQEAPYYRKGGSGTDGTCDCIGLIIGALERCGAKWTGTHGSNYAARYEVYDLRKITAYDELEPGDIVFKAYSVFDDEWDLPRNYGDHPDQNDYYHVGVVTSVQPLTITHCTKPTVIVDTTLGKWAYVAKLNQIEGFYHPLEKKIAVIDRPAGTVGETVNVRSGAGKSYSRIGTVRFGDSVVVSKDLGEWVFIEAGGLSGYVMSNYILYDSDGDTDPDVPDDLSVDMLDKLRECMKLIDDAGALLGKIVGRG